MQLTGEMLIGRAAIRGQAGSQRAFNPTANAEIPEPEFGLGSREDVERAVDLATRAFDSYRNLPLERRAAFLEAIAEEILALGDALIERAHAESGLPVARLTGERARTAGQLRLFAQVVRDGHFLRATIDTAQPERQPAPRADLRLAKIPLGPVAVFGASNFPLAFSVAGGDTASALAAGAPVIVKAHSAHLGTSELVGRAIQKAAERLDMPEGVFSLLIGAGRDIGEALVAHPGIKAVGFTGSRQGGLALLRIANSRHEPIPVYAEMSSINPVFLLPRALSARTEALAQGFADSLTMGAGQFCTNPGLVLAIDGPDLQRFVTAAGKALSAKAAQTMLTPGIHAAYESGRAQVDALEGVERVASGAQAGGQANAAQAALYVTDAQRLLRTPELQAEMFGPASVVVKARSLDELLQVADLLEGQLTATLHLDEGDHSAARRLLPVLERKCGRILANGFPTGVEVCHAMVHGGPFPATSNAMYSSVGSSAIDRFLRPVCYQDIADELLPAALQQANPQGVWRLVDGAMEQP
ncbi:NADP-dependent fatty aldehyde dehydrogenase [Achromobacter insolitus]|uniref:aldehyde dehydrogenase (NADP(+)) n=1 Tax=Achromobacter insolitus TaxID=217204 RepID=UPI0009728A4E|nr:aldehyde dehydrogenase (NADP(+)) [Achromobacter insolitus]APX76262.1 aldehyde dehydrogenase (NADP(+)) [Achromobacter insolitus]OWT57979.1 aldehyde dehydrogenase (NADP(+)) [Achromobacter insolitus]CAB3722737.1 Alpha-ketoglutaric semialdehyde dehydrogenase 2 [Achromobacter insolitus]VEG66417.1 NADP-dependent fatty aldehyde dehydrogenase [Achromobacter insolitus]